MRKKAYKLVPLLLAFALLLTGCGEEPPTDGENPTGGTYSPALGDDDDTFGDALDDLGVWDGYFEDAASDITVTCLSGTANSYKFENNTLTFTAIGEDTVYSVSGKLKGNIVIDVGDNFKFDLEMHGLNLVSDSANPILVKSGNEVSLTAKKDCTNYIYDMREAVDADDETLYASAIYSLVDLEICGKGKLTVVSENNNGIHTKDDLQVKNLTLYVVCTDNALKGNDSVELENATTTLIATAGDGIKTSNSNISDKGNQRGTVTVTGGTHTVYAACDGIDAAYNAVINDASTVLTIYTDKYSNYSEEVTAVAEDVYYLRFSSNSYKYSVKYYNSETDYTWVNAEYHSKASGSRSTYYYYSFPKMTQYSKLQFFIYDSDMEQGQETDYAAASEAMTPSTAYDTIAISTSSYGWTNYTTTVQEGGFGGRPGMGGMGGGMGGMNDGNTDKGDHSTKGIKAANEILITNGTVNVKAYDDAIHANNDTTLENGATPTGNVTISGGTVSVYSNDDGIHADGTLTVTAGTVNVSNSYEGIEGTYVKLMGGDISVISSDDGVNATTTTGTAITIGGGKLYIYCNGDGIDSNSKTASTGIVFSGGNTVVISTSNGNSAIDTEKGYQYTGGTVLAIMPTGGMSEESTNCQSFSSIGTQDSTSLKANTYLTVKANGKETLTLKVPKAMSAILVYLGSNDASFSSDTSTDKSLDKNGICWG